MSETRHDEPAFPVTACEYGGNGPFLGMNLRDYFAAKAMQALIAKFPLQDAEGEHGMQTTRDANAVIYHELSDSAYRYADAMLQIRNT